MSPFVDRRHGTERALAEVLERLARNYNCEIHLYSQRVEDLSFQVPAAFSAENTSGIFWHKIPSAPGPHLMQFLFWFYINRFYRWMDESFRGASFDLVLSPGVNCSDADVVIVHALFHRLRELSKETASVSEAGFLRRLHRRAYYALLSRLETHVYSKPKVSLATVSPRIAKLLEDYFHRQEVPVIPNAVDPLQFSSALRLQRRAQARASRRFLDDELILLLIGNDWANKGLPTVLKALAELSDLHVRLLVVGGDDPAPWREMARRIGIVDRCLWESPCADILNAYAAADLYVSPSREDSFGMPVAEAMACGLPVITSAYAGVSSLLREGVDSFILQDPLDSKTLAERIRVLCVQSDLASRMGHAAANASSEWTWDRNAAAVWRLLQRASSA
ncbi:MAG TPA: glycosyltransferase family 4 protein [Candidatus Acidoferrum sp.]|nr:glycosyltransferase family 4 protein [Candidatus Acidoferrum sp.]